VEIKDKCCGDRMMVDFWVIFALFIWTIIVFIAGIKVGVWSWSGEW